MMLDGHIHIQRRAADGAGLLAGFRRAGVDGGIVISLPPPSFRISFDTAPAAERIDHVLAWRRDLPSVYPFFWIDPLEPDAAEQVELAAAKGVMGFKVICDRFFPGDERAMRVFAAIAAVRRPIMFHSGILWDGGPSSMYNRPAEFEALLDVKGLRFSMAHISWPWCDELIAVYGKFLHVGANVAGGVELFVDTTPGTPPIYRRDALTKLFLTGYEVSRHVFFGSDCSANAYDSDWACRWVERDRGVLEDLGLDQATIAGVFSENLKRFVGVLP